MEYRLSKAIFSKESVLKAVYLWQKDYNIVISEDEIDFILNVSAKNGGTFNFGDFNAQVQEQQLREILNNQFGTLRDCIYSKAFAQFTSRE